MVQKKRLSLAVLSYNMEPHLEKLALEAAESYQEADELIITEDGGAYSEKLRRAADLYVFGKDNKGFTWAVNTALRVARGDYIAIVNSDTRLETGKLHDLCVPGTVTSPEITSQPAIRGFAGSFFVIPRTVLEKVGELESRLKVYYSDTEYVNRLNSLDIPTKTIYEVKVHHHVAQTVHSVPHKGGGDEEMYEKIEAEKKE